MAQMDDEGRALAVEAGGVGLWDWDLATGRFRSSSGWLALLGLPAGQEAERPEDWLDRVHPEDRGAVQAAIDAHVEGATPLLEVEHRIRRADDSWAHWLVRGRAVRHGGRAVRLSGAASDVTALNEAHARLLHAAVHDAATGLPTRGVLAARIADLLHAARNGGRAFAVAVLDLDGFERVNDAVGAEGGDEVLREVSRRFDAACRDGDVVARLASDEFGVLLPGVEDPETAAWVSARFQDAVRRPIAVRGEELRLTACVGFAIVGGAHARSEDVLRDASTALHVAKLGGRGRLARFTPDMRSQAIEALRLDSELERAIERGELRVRYQAIVRLDEGRIDGFEALVRWQHPSRGLLHPAEFVAAAEEAGLDVGLGGFVLERAVAQLAAWHARFGRDDLTMSVNVTPRHFAHPGLLAEVALRLEQSRVPPPLIKLELTESTVMARTEESVERLRRLRELGVQLQLDDFGTGYSSLGYLERFPVSSVKIDQSFVRDLTAGRDDVVRAVLDLARGMRLDVVAEGIETPEQLERLRDLRCPHGQGYLFSSPLEESEMEALLARDPRW